MRLNRRKFLGAVGTFGAVVALPAIARAQESRSIWDVFTRDRVMRDIDRDGNTASALSLIETVEPILSFDTAYNLQLAIQNYEQFVAARGSWDPPHRDWFGLRLGDSRKAVQHLKRRLMINGDMAVEKRIDDTFDARLDAAVRLFQARHGVNINGQIDEPTFYALSVPTEQRLNQLRLNALRIEQWASALTDRYVVVNIPAAKIEAVESSMVVQRHTAVVGRIDRQTPILNSKIHEINFNPYWHVPKSIIRKDLIKYMNEDPQYLTNSRIRIYDSRGNELQPTDIDWSTEEAVQYAFRQDPGPDNSLGHVKINFPNPHAVYLHDTPTKGLFGESARFLSSGCVRVEEVDQLVAWLLRDNGGWDVASVQAAFNSSQRLDVAVQSPVPIHTTYITAWANRQGTVSFRDDVYAFDATGKVEFET